VRSTGRRHRIKHVAIIAGWLLPQIGFVVAGGILAEIVNAL
jgi:hypothetical protein